MKQFATIWILLAIHIALQAQNTNGLIGYYSFCNCNANDNSGNGNHGTLIGDPACTPGQRGEGFLFNQISTGNGCGQSGGECVKLPTLGPIWANGFTVCAWVRFDNESYFERIVDIGNGSGDSGGLPVWFGREGATNNLALESWISNDAQINRSTGRLVATNVISNGSIEYYCATINEDTMRIYVNGVLKAEKAGHPILNIARSSNFIGRSNWCNADPDFKGFMDEVRIYNRALSAAEINDLYLKTPSFASFQSPVNPGSTVQLEAQGGVSYEWTPSTGLNNPNISNPVATVYQTTTYTCKISLADGCYFTDSLTIEVLAPGCTSLCSGTLGDNIFPDGDFGSGQPNILPNDPGIAPEYSYTVNPPPGDGFYCVANNTTSWGSFADADWINIKDNSANPNGYMMVVNASNQPGIFYQKTVNVCENTVYEFSADIINMLENHLSHLIQPNIAFIIDGQVVCETGDISADEQWHTYRFSFATAQGQSSVSLALRNNAPGGAGNDLALDNISFRACGPTIVVPSVRNYCRGATATISAGLENSPYATVYYQWQTNENGNWINIPGANAINLEIAFPENAQQYRLLVANSSFNLSEPNCRIASNPITLQQLPDLDLQMNTENVVCKGDSNGSASVQPLSGQSPYTYLWNTGATNSMISGLAPAQYSATIVDQLGCSGNISAAITEAEMALDLVLDSKNVSCQGASDGSLAATITGGVAPFSILWNTGQSIDSLEKLLPGNYKITITDANQCMITDSIEVSVGETPAAILTGELEIELGDIIEAKVTSDFDKATIENYTWIAGDLVSDCQECDQYSFQPTGDGCLQVIIEDYRGCIATDSICYKAIPKNRVFVPNVFSPNDDGKNDWFSLFSDNSVEQVLLFTVYDRWGAIVYQKDSLQPNDETSGWDGTSNGKYCENGVYIWVAEVMFINNQKNTYNGDVTLIR